METKICVVEGLEYVMDEFGNITKRRGRGYLKQFPDKDGYLKFAFCVKGVTVNKFVHRLVYETFVGPIPPGLTIDHEDNDKTNNHYKNLQLMGAVDNVIKGNAKNWVAISPTGEIVEIYNLAKFCRDNNLHRGHMGDVLRGKPKYNAHKGWRKHHE